MNINIDFPKKLATAYNAVCKPLCRELNICLLYTSQSPRD